MNTKFNLLKKWLILGILTLILVSTPKTTRAFEIGQLIDPFCLFACGDNDPAPKPVPPVVDPILGVSCYSNYIAGNVGDTLTWVAYAYGGNGHYSYSWTGTNGLTGNASNASIIYTTGGVKTASVTVVSGKQTISKACNSIKIAENFPTPVYNPPPVYHAPPPAVHVERPVYPNLTVSCYSSYTIGNIGDSISWSSSVSGGTGSYLYSWSGADGLSGVGPTASITYTKGGSKTAAVTVVSGTQTVTKTCGSVVIYTPQSTYNPPYIPPYTPPTYNYSNSPLSVNCYPGYLLANIGEVVTWKATGYGGNGNYNITWTGTDGLYGTGPNISIQYGSGGTKSASVTVTSGGQTISRSCGSIEISQPNVNNNYNYNNNNYNNSALSVNCYANYTFGVIGSSINWISSAYGGNGNYYTTWNGSDGLSGTGASISMVYNYPGTKSASVTVTSGGQTITRNCGSVSVYDSNSSNQNYNGNNYYNNNYNNGYYGSYYNSTPLSITCSANMTFAQVGTRVMWRAYPTGGNGSYAYQWSGTDSVGGTSNFIELYYNSNGVKTASVTVISAGQTVTQTCTNTITVGTPINTYVPTQQTYTQPQTIIKYVNVPAKNTDKEVKPSPKPTPTPTPTNSVSPFSSIAISWGWVSFLVILVLLFTIVYLIFNKKS